MGIHAKLKGTSDQEVRPARGVTTLALAAMLRLWADGVITRQQIIEEFSLDAGDVAELDWLRTRYMLATDKDKFLSRLVDLLVLAEQGRLGMEIKATFQAAVEAVAS